MSIVILITISDNIDKGFHQMYNINNFLKSSKIQSKSKTY